EGYINNIELIETSDNNGAIAMKIETEGKTYLIYSKIDSKMDLLSKDLRPKYDYDKGKVKFSKFETDAHQFFAIIDKDTIDYEAFYCIKVKYDDKTLFERKPLIYDLQFDGLGARLAPPKVKKWSDKYIKK
ncbi:MAG: hypothetical protein QG635_1649, partial [Bacteroidota bacterium]|nr:hypothetical protein [Bacteroidota bacterium]